MKHSIPIVLAVLLTSSSCTQKSTQMTPSPTPSINETHLIAGKVLAQSQPEDLPFKMYQFLSPDPKNLCLSPMSLEQAFSMVYLGSNGSTKTQIEQLFGFKADEVASLESEEPGAGIDFFWGNSVWAKPNKSLSPSYIETIKKRLGADYQRTLELPKINAWVAKTTHDKIKDLIQQLDLNTLVVLVNAFYLNAPWEKPFEKKQNLFGTFQSSPHLASQVTYLSRISDMQYYEDARSTWVELPYVGGQLSMILALPKKKHDLRSIEDQFSAAYLKTVLNGFKSESVDFKMPKFKMETSLSFSKMLQDMGYADLFRVGDFSRMSIQPEVKISEVLQATYLKVDENGTEAAAATAVVMEKGSAFSEPKPFFANEPFIFLIRNKKSQKIYFLGRVVDPKI